MLYEVITEDFDLGLLGELVLVDPDDHVAATVDGSLLFGRRFLDA